MSDVGVHCLTIRCRSFVLKLHYQSAAEIGRITKGLARHSSRCLARAVCL